VPVIVLTGSQDDELIGRAFDLGATAVLHKPYSAELLESAVGAALEGAARVDRRYAA
jgi:DNA-binding NarL/FixJ family response regulator